jgi:hypothetical protein
MVGAPHHRPERCLMPHAVLAVVAVLVAIPAAAQNRMQPPPTATPQTPVHSPEKLKRAT